MDNITEESFVEYRLEKSRGALHSAEILYNHRDLVGANNRAYYSIFYAIRAVLAIEKKDFKKHKDVVAYFNKNYVSTEIFPKIIGKKISQAKKIREDNDYDEEYEPSSERTLTQIDTAEELIKLVEKYLEDFKEGR